MKYKLLPTLLFLFIFFPLQAQNELIIKETNQSQIGYTLSTIRKITFNNGELIVAKTDNTFANFALTNIQRLVFINNPDNVKDVPLDRDAGINLYPNPVKDYLHVVLPQAEDLENYHLKVLNVNGQTLISQQFGDTGILKVDISMLPSGIYVCQCYNGSQLQVKKFVKQ